MGLLFIALGIYILTFPIKTYLTLTAFFTISFIVTGLLEIYFSIVNQKVIDDWGWHLAGGILSVLIGILLIAYPEIPITTLPFVIGFSLLFRSFQGLGLAFDLKNYGILNWGNLALASTIGIIFSLILLGHPVFTAISLVTITALTFIWVGISGIILAFNMKKLKNLPNQLSNDLKYRIEQLEREYNQQIHSPKTTAHAV
ncbi:HdeD family acid-resistance protein [Niastella yeongjuensis]|uniref:HdeD family acid-resistance protein n=1 Tax=Niastella yeongjuensis TaxID=354355 RepID=UPI001F6046E0|nr:DUF308 domain-containing protein [Niastella yeongjuensis]